MGSVVLREKSRWKDRSCPSVLDPSQQVTPHPSVFLEGAKKIFQEDIFKLRECKAQMFGFAANGLSPAC